MKFDSSLLILLLATILLITLWHLVTMLISLVVMLAAADRHFGGFEHNEAFWAVIPITLGSFLFGFLGFLPAYFSYKHLLSFFSRRFSLNVGHQRRYFALAVLLLYGLPLSLIILAMIH